VSERWQGSVDERLNDSERRLDGINGHVKDMAVAVVELRIAMARTAVRFAIGGTALILLINVIAALAIYELTRR